MQLCVATCQVPVSGDIAQNLRWILAKMRRARAAGAELAHFPEAALSGYVGIHIRSFHRYPYDQLADAARQIQRLAKGVGLWVVFGSAHRLTRPHKPHNCVYVIDDGGRIVDRYDKRFCTGDIACKGEDLQHYTPGNHATVFNIKRVRCGVQICHDVRYPELYRQAKRQGVQLMLHSYHNACRNTRTLKSDTNIWAIIIPSTMQAYAASNHMWISASNTGSRLSAWPSFFVQPEGRITGKLRRGQPGILLSTVDTESKLFDSSRHWRSRAMRGTLHSGRLVRDVRSSNRTSL